MYTCIQKRVLDSRRCRLLFSSPPSSQPSSSSPRFSFLPSFLSLLLCSRLFVYLSFSSFPRIIKRLLAGHYEYSSARLRRLIRPDITWSAPRVENFLSPLFFSFELLFIFAAYHHNLNVTSDRKCARKILQNPQIIHNDCGVCSVDTGTFLAGDESIRE